MILEPHPKNWDMVYLESEGLLKHYKIRVL